MSGMNNQFYKDNAPNYDEFKVLDSLFEGLTGVFDDIMSQAIDNSKISTMRAFSRIPIQIINVVDACYSLPTLLTNKEVLNTTGISPELSVQDRINAWNSLEPKIKATALEQMGLVLMLVNPNILRGENAYTDTFKVIDFEMYDFNTGDRLIYGLDYYYEYNKIYFLRFGSHTNKYNNKKVILKNITIDNNTPEKILGESLGIYANSNFSPTEYRDVVTSFASAALAGPVISTMNQSFNPDTHLNLAIRTYGLNDYENSLKGIKIIDYKSADDLKKKFWDTHVEGIDKLNPFDFLVTIPSDYLYKTEKMEYVQEFIKKIKPAHSNFVLNPEYFIKDILALRYANFSFRTEGEMTGIVNKIKYKELRTASTSHITHDKINTKLDLTKKHPKHTTKDYLDVVNMAHFFEHRSNLANKDNIECKKETNFKKIYLDHITRVHVPHSAYHVSDEVLLDTDWFDCLTLLDDFRVKMSGTMYDKIPEMKTGKFAMAWVKFLLDKISAKETSNAIVKMVLNEKVDITYRDVYEPIMITDADTFLDSIYLSDVRIENDGAKSLKDKITAKDTVKSYKLSADNLYDKITKKDESKGYMITKPGMISDSIRTKEIRIKSSGIKSPKDKIKATETVDSLELNADNLYDKIINKDNPKGCMITGSKDTLSFVPKANIPKCDSIYSCDYAKETSFRLDAHNGIEVDENAIGYEEISIKLIPKN